MCTVQRQQRLSVICYAQLHTKMHQQQHKALTQVVPEGGGAHRVPTQAPPSPGGVISTCALGLQLAGGLECRRLSA